jgi:predicted ATPase
MSTPAALQPSKTPMSPPRPRLQRFSVEGLFGRYDHNIPLRQAERVTVIHGPNGVGKTAVLRLMEAACQGKLEEILPVLPFRRLTVELTNGAQIIWRVAATLEEQVDLSRLGWKLLWDVVMPDGAQITWSDRKSSWVKRLDDLHVGESDADISAALKRDEHMRPLLVADTYRSLVEYRRAASLVQNFRRETLLVRIDRLRQTSVDTEAEHRWHEGRDGLPTVSPPTIDLYSDALRQDYFRETLDEYNELAQTLAQSFVKRLIRTREPLNIPDLHARLNDVEARRIRLRRWGLLPDLDDSTPIVPDEVDPRDVRALSLNVEDNEAMLPILEQFAAKLVRLEQSMNSRLLHKQLRLSRARGLEILDADDQVLALDKLSSGEQHQLILLFDMLFHTRPGALVLIDEPELSLHMTWQELFLPEIMEIAALNDIDFVVATHSPDIIGRYVQLEVPLTGECRT